MTASGFHMRPSTARHALAAALALSLPVACSSEDTAAPGAEGAGGAATTTTKADPSPLPPLGDVVRTTEKTLEPAVSVATEPRNPQLPEELAAMRKEGWGALKEAPGHAGA